MRRYPAIWVLAALVVMALTATGCRKAEVVFVSEGTSYTYEQLEELQASQTPPRSVAAQPVAEASRLRHAAVVSLRSRGGEAAELAEFVTQTLDDTGRSVPYYGEVAVVEGTGSWVLLEAWGPEGGTLDNTRLWAFAREDGRVLYSSTGR